MSQGQKEKGKSLKSCSLSRGSSKTHDDIHIDNTVISTDEVRPAQNYNQLGMEKISLEAVLIYTLLI